MSYLKLLPIGGLTSNFIGAIMLYFSINPSLSGVQGFNDKKELWALPAVGLNAKLAKRGLKFVVFGFFIQLLALFLQF